MIRGWLRAAPAASCARRSVRHYGGYGGYTERQREPVSSRVGLELRNRATRLFKIEQDVWQHSVVERERRWRTKGDTAAGRRGGSGSSSSSSSSRASRASSNPPRCGAKQASVAPKVWDVESTTVAPSTSRPSDEA